MRNFNGKTAAFEKTFPTAEAQQKYVQGFSKKYPALSLCGTPLRNLAIASWNPSESSRGAAAGKGEEKGLTGFGNLFQNTEEPNDG